jgi:hypothetical protein
MIKLLILEDDLETLSRLLEQMQSLEQKLNQRIAVTVMGEYWQVQDYLNTNPKEQFDLILLDRDCKAGGLISCAGSGQIPESHHYRHFLSSGIQSAAERAGDRAGHHQGLPRPRSVFG